MVGLLSAPSRVTHVSHDYSRVALSALSRALDEVDHSYAECCIGCAGKSEMRKQNTWLLQTMYEHLCPYIVHLNLIWKPGGTLGE